MYDYHLFMGFSEEFLAAPFGGGGSFYELFGIAFILRRGEEIDLFLSEKKIAFRIWTNQV